MRNMHTQQLTFTKWRLHQDLCYSVLKNVTYIDINQEWRGQISFSVHDKIKTNY